MRHRKIEFHAGLWRFGALLCLMACATDERTSAASGGAGHGTSSAGNAGRFGTGGTKSVAGTAGDPATHEVMFMIDSSAARHAISPYVYGTNQGDFKKEAKGLTLTRVGGNRLTAYNWESNASNAGSDYMYQNDAYISSSKVAGEPMKLAVQAASDAAASIIMTVPMAGWVSADLSGPCAAHPASNAIIAQHFQPMVAKKNAVFAYPPDTGDGNVYADEFVAWLEAQFPARGDPARRIFYMLDNEPDLWAATHSEIYPNPLKYADLIQQSTDFAQAIKGAAPDALVFGPASYGWQGFVSLQNAPDANNRDFLEFYLDAMKAAEQSSGKRLLDVLDVHWYPEAQGDAKRITDDGISAGEVQARLQAPRSLWDASYTEKSWIVDASTHGPIALIPRLQKKIAEHYPDTKLSISEYFYGAGGDISGGLAQADVLGIFGREGLFAATSWLGKNTGFVFGAFALYRNYDGAGATFLDTSIAATTSAQDESSVYASVASDDASTLVIVALNKTTSPLRASIAIKHPSDFKKADAYALSGASQSPVKGGSITAVGANAFSYVLPARSATTLVFHR